MREHYTRQRKPYTSAWMHMHNANSWENQRSGEEGTCKQDKSMTSSCLSVSPSLSITLLLCLSLLFPCPFPSFFHSCIFYSFLFPSFLQSPTWPGGGGHGEWRFMQIYLIRWEKNEKNRDFSPWRHFCLSLSSILRLPQRCMFPTRLAFCSLFIKFYFTSRANQNVVFFTSITLTSLCVLPLPYLSHPGPFHIPLTVSFSGISPHP